MSEYSSKQVHARTHARDREATFRRNTAPISAHAHLCVSAGDVRMRQRGKGFAAHLHLSYFIFLIQCRTVLMQILVDVKCPTLPR